MQKHFILCLAIIALLPLLSRADTSSDLKVEVALSADSGWPTRILVSGTVSPDIAWLGQSFYSYGVTDPIKQGKHTITELKKGAFNRELLVDPKALDGSFEVALWGKKVLKEACRNKDCYWCKTNGFHLEDLLVYKSGLLTRQTGYK